MLGRINSRSLRFGQHLFVESSVGRLVHAVVAATGVALSGFPAVVVAAEPQAAPKPKLELIDPPPVPLPSAFSTKGQRPKSNPNVLPPAATKLDPALQRLAAPATLALPDKTCLLYTSPSPRDRQKSRMPSSA